MTTAVLYLGSKNYVLSVEDAVKVADMLGQAETYEQEWRPDNKTTHHIYPCEEAVGSISFLPDSAYQMYKLAGKPQDK